jgi:GDP-L-fucose synthase
MEQDSKIFVAGYRGLVGSGIVKTLKQQHYNNLILKSSEELDLTDAFKVRKLFESERPEYVIDSAAMVGGIKANMTYPAEFMYYNLQIQNNLIWAAKEVEVKKFLFLGSSCIYPRESPQPIIEEYFMRNRPEPTNEAYAYAKIAGMKLCEYIYEEYNYKFISCMPTNIYGENDNFDPETSHVIPALIQRIDDAKNINQSQVVIWGSGSSRREFMYIDDAADAIVWLMNCYDDKQFINIGTGEDISIKELAFKIKELIGYEGDLVFDPSKPDGMPKKLLDVSRLNKLGWKHKTSLDEGLIYIYRWYKMQQK